MKTGTYNGWTNYETWVVNLWIDNEQGSQLYWAERAEEIARTSHESDYLTRQENARRDLAEALKSEHEDAQPELPGVFGDLLGHALGGVDWDEIAAAMLDEVDADVWTAEPEDW